MGIQAQALRALLNSGQPFIAADVYSALTGRIVEQVGFKACYMGGAACGSMHYAVPDIGILSQVEQIEQAARIVGAINIPLMVDADTLGETVADAFHLTRRYEQAGVAGFHVEDEINPKHSGYDNGLASIADMQARIRACVQARQDPAFVIIARCDELYASAINGGGTGSVEEAIKRGRAYAEAGADALVYPMSNAEQQIEINKAKLPIPVCAMGFPLPDAAFLISTGWGVSGAASIHMERARKLLETGVPDFGGAAPFDDTAVLDKVLYRDLITDWAKQTGRPTR